LETPLFTMTHLLIQVRDMLKIRLDKDLFLYICHFCHNQIETLKKTGGVRIIDKYP
jgi:hypothetical protein